jgi:cation transport ATPase
MVVNYFDIHRCECIWEQDVPLLVAPENTAEQLLKMRGFYCGEDGKWYKQLSKQESQYLYSRRNMLIVDLPENEHSSSYDTEESHEDKKKAAILNLITIFLIYGVGSLNYLIYKSFNINTFPITALSVLVGTIMTVYIRIKYPKNKFSKVLMTLYIVEDVLVLIGIIAVIIACNSCTTDCRGCSV